MRMTSKVLTRPKTGILMMNMGGPATIPEVKPFLTNLFNDRDLLKLPFNQEYAAKFIVERRYRKIEAHYDEIGGGSPIGHWTKIQGEKMVKILDEQSPETAPHKFYIGFRYAAPLTETAIAQIEREKPEHVIAFTQYPQYSCATTGSSLNHVARLYNQSGEQPSSKWSVIDRWPEWEGLIDAMVECTKAGLEQIPIEDRYKAVILFSAHSLPLSAIERGDPYAAEVGATVYQIMKKLNFCNPWRLTWQSQVGPKKWLEPKTDQVLGELSKRGRRSVVVVPVAFTSDHIETLHELDIEFREEAEKANLKHYIRAPALNDNDTFCQSLADRVMHHLNVEIPSGRTFTPQLGLRCPKCTNPSCQTMRNFFNERKRNFFESKPVENENYTFDEKVAIN